MKNELLETQLHPFLLSRRLDQCENFSIISIISCLSDRKVLALPLDVRYPVLAGLGYASGALLDDELFTVCSGGIPLA